MGQGPSGTRPAGPRPDGPDPHPRSARFIVYARAYCHLCDEMLAALEPLSRELGFGLTVLDVDADPALVERWDEAVPVLATAGGIEICRHVLDRARLETALAERRPDDADLLK